MRTFRDIETGEILTYDEVKTEYESLREMGETEAQSFADYLNNCTEGSGFLEEVRA